MLLLAKKDRDAIVAFLESIVVPAQTGANIIQVTTLLKSLGEHVIEEKVEKPQE